MTAQAAGSPLDFATYGIAGLVIVALLLGWMWPKPSIDRLVKDHERELADLRRDHDRVVGQRDALFRMTEDKVIPALTQSNAITSALQPVLEDVVRALEEVRLAAEPQRGRDA